MLLSINKLLGMSVEATDGSAGKVHDIFFDGSSWKVRYFVLEIGGFLSGRKVLVTPVAIKEISRKSLVLNISGEQVKGSPAIDLHLPVSMQQINSLHEYYAWPLYEDFLTLPVIVEHKDKRPLNVSQDDQSLRSSREVKGYDVYAKQEKVGYVDDFIFSADCWCFIYLVSHIGGFFSAEKLLLSPSWIKAISWEKQALEVDHTKEEILNSPRYDPSGEIKREFEEKLHDYFKRNGYWK